MVIGRKSIYWISSIIAIMAFGLMMIYFIVFGDICSTLMSDVIYGGKNGFWSSRVIYILMLAAALFPLIIRKELKELKIASLILFLGVASFIFIFLFQILFEGNFDNLDESYSEYLVMKNDIKDIKGIAIIIVAFSFQQNVFPMYNSLKEQSNENALRASRKALGIIFVVYVITAVLGLFFFGSVIDQNVLNNVARE